MSDRDIVNEAIDYWKKKTVHIVSFNAIRAMLEQMLRLKGPAFRLKDAYIVIDHIIRTAENLKRTIEELEQKNK
jgi:hypothetical protein